MRILCKQEVARILANPIYAGSFICKRKTNDLASGVKLLELIERAPKLWVSQSRPSDGTSSTWS